MQQHAVIDSKWGRLGGGWGGAFKGEINGG